MTLEEVRKLSDSELQVKVAELCGWKDKRGYWINSELFSKTTGAKGFQSKPPNYPQDLNAMHEAEKTFPNWQQIDYLMSLGRILGHSEKKSPIFNTIHATARQRAEAFILTLSQ